MKNMDICSPKTKRDHKFIEKLESLLVDRPKVAGARLGAMVVHKNKILSIGFNEYTFSFFQKRYGTRVGQVYLHAEVSAIHNALKQGISLKKLSMCTLYVARIKETHKSSRIFIPGNCTPCPGCRDCINNFNIRKVVISHDGHTQRSL